MNPIIEVLNIGRFVILQKCKMDGEDMLRQVFSSFSFGKNENGDPHFLWHPVRGIGKLIEWLEKRLYHLFRLREERELDKERKAAAGAILAISVIVISVGTTAGLLWLLGEIHPWLKLMMESMNYFN